MTTTVHRFNYDNITILATEERKGSRLVLELELLGPKAIIRSIDLPSALQALRSEATRQKNKHEERADTMAIQIRPRNQQPNLTNRR